MVKKLYSFHKLKFSIQAKQINFSNLKLVVCPTEPRSSIQFNRSRFRNKSLQVLQSTHAQASSNENRDHFGEPRRAKVSPRPKRKKKKPEKNVHCRPRSCPCLTNRLDSVRYPFWVEASLFC